MTEPVRDTIPPDGEWLAQFYLTPLISPTPVATRLPRPDDTADTVNDFVRVESGGTVKYLPMTPNPHWLVSTILHAYSPNEISAMNTGNKIAGHMAAARGKTLAGWYVVRVTNIVTAHRLTDPMVNLIRYRAMATWLVTGHPLT